MYFLFFSSSSLKQVPKCICMIVVIVKSVNKITLKSRVNQCYTKKLCDQLTKLNWIIMYTLYCMRLTYISLNCRLPSTHHTYVYEMNTFLFQVIKWSFFSHDLNKFTTMTKINRNYLSTFTEYIYMLNGIYCLPLQIRRNVFHSA